jgi:hypothetical protein
MTFVALANITLGSSASSVTFSSIPATFRDLVLACSAQASSGAGVKIRVNGLTTAIYNSVVMFGDGTSAVSYLPSNGATTLGLEALGTSTASPLIVQLMDYSATDKHKTFLVRQSIPNGANGVSALAGRAGTTDAITSLQFLFENSTTYSAGSTFALYGIAS